METIEADGSIALKKIISQDSARITTEIRAEIGELESQYLSARRDQKLGMGLILLTFLSPHLLSIISEHSLMALLFLAIFAYGLFTGFKLIFGKLEVINNYNAALNSVVFPKVFTLLGLNGVLQNVSKKNNNIPELPFSIINTNTWTIHKILNEFEGGDSIEKNQVSDDLEKSELITEPHNTNQVDNIIEVDYKDSIIRIAELDIRHNTGSGKNKQTNFIFHGYFVSFDLKKELTGKTFVSTDSDKRGFANLSVFGNTGEGQARETILEWNEFENLLHVATTDEVEARYILTPNFMHDLYDWWQGRKTNIRLSFIGNRLYILYPDDKIRINQTVEKITDEAITDYIFSITWPMKNTIKLIDDVRL